MLLPDAITLPLLWIGLMWSALGGFVPLPDAVWGAVVGYLSEKLGIPKDEIATIGDSENDVSMFKQGGFAIAMGNADEETQAQADVVVADCDSEGFAEAIETHILPRAKGRGR